MLCLRDTVLELGWSLGARSGGGEDPAKGRRPRWGLSDCSWGWQRHPDSTCGKTLGSGRSAWELGGIGTEESSLLKVRRLQKGVTINCEFWNVRTRSGLKDCLVSLLLSVVLQIQAPPFRKLKPSEGKTFAPVDAA